MGTIKNVQSFRRDQSGFPVPVSNPGLNYLQFDITLQQKVAFLCDTIIFNQSHLNK